MRRTVIAVLALVLVAGLGRAPAFAQTQRTDASLTSTTCPGSGCFVYLTRGSGSVGIQVSGTFVGTLTFEQSLDNVHFTNWSVYANGDATGSLVHTTTSTGLWTGVTAGVTQIRVRFSAHSSGTATISVGQSQARAGWGSGGGGGGGGGVSSVDNDTIGVLFTSSWATTTSTPRFSFDFSAAAANKVLAGPTTGANAVPTFRSLVAADIPSLTSGTSLLKGDGSGKFANYAGSSCTNQAVTAVSAAGAASCTTLTSAYVNNSIWTGTVSSGLLKASAQGTVAQASAGTDYQTPTGTPAGFVIASQAAGDTLYASSASAWARLAKGTNGQVLTLASGLPSWADVSATAPGSTTNAVYNGSGSLAASTGITFNSTAATLANTNLTAPATKTANFTLTCSSGPVYGDTSGGGFTLTLPVTCAAGHLFYVKKTSTGDTNSLTIATSSGTIDGASTIAVKTANDGLTAVFDGTNFAVIGGGYVGITDPNVANAALRWNNTNKALEFTGGISITSGKSLTVSNILTFTGTDSSSVAFGAGGTVAYTGVDVNTSGQVTATHLASALPSAQGGTDVTTHTDDAVLIGNGTVYQSKVIPDCPDTGGNHLNYTQSSNGISCGTSGGGGGASDYLATLSSAEISITGAVTATISRQHVISGTSGSYTVNLPACASNAGKFIGFRVATSGSTKLYTLDGNSTETIDGALTRILWAGESATLLCDGTNWSKIAGKTIPMAVTMYQGSTQTISTDVDTKTNLDSVEVDNTGLMADTTNHYAVIKRAGNYAVDAHLSVTAGAAITFFESSVNVNSTTGISQDAGSVAASAWGTMKASKGATPFLVADTVQLNIYQSSAANQTLQNGPTLVWLSVREIPSW
jgi:hypothetical protein